ncbi:hypothetical protein ACFQ3L_10615 [Lacticaseibacillus jixianensis]|uniref:YfhD family protein n=1 Tax=Lacticaseibacillus jixianensis TaxID=2486012 RepID=A0ABW4BCF8_9LACO|nr:hypothetical protein [Lacticaseibacillus jixianensis]
MSLFKKSRSDQPALPQSYDFAKMVRKAREEDPGRFAKLQAAFRGLKKAPKKDTHRKEDQ